MAEPAALSDAPLVLLVDDSADTVALMARLLKRSGFRTVQAESVADALAAADAHRIDLLVSDVTLPDGTGHDLMRQLRGRSPALRGIAVSGHGADADRDDSLAAGFARHLTKPIDFAAFVQVCRDVLALP